MTFLVFLFFCHVPSAPADPIPTVHELHLPLTNPQSGLKKHSSPSPGVSDPLLEKARELRAFDDFKPLSDARKKPLSAKARAALEKKVSLLKTEKERVRAYIEGAYDFEEELLPAKGITQALWKVETGNPAWDAAFAYTEKVWPTLLRKTPQSSTGSLLVSPYPIMIAAPGRFHEAYYWDTYFGLKGLLATGRLEIAQMLVENLLHFVQVYGLVPNGGRDYYLTRSQPPFLSSMVKEVYEASLEGASPKRKKHLESWLRKRAYPLVKLDYEKFWMNPKTRYDENLMLNHHWDSLDLPRPERHAFDDEKALGLTFRDVRAAAESGLDFTVAFDKQASVMAGVLLNSILSKVEKDSSWMAASLGLESERASFDCAWEKRFTMARNFLWNETEGTYENFNLRTRLRVPVLSAAILAALYARFATTEQAARMKAKLAVLEKAGGLMASNAMDSPHQWDGANGWPPFQVMAIEGLRNYGYHDDAKRLAEKWVDALARIHAATGAMYERIDVVRVAKPGPDTDKYPTQLGFLWTNASYVWALTEVLGKKIVSNQGAN